MVRAILSFSLLVSFATAAAAQVEPYNPYAPVRDDKPAVAADGKLHWPSFFKSADIQLRFQSLLAVDACQGTNKSITNPVINNRLVIDDLPESSVSGRVTAVEPGVLEIVDDAGKKHSIITHPAGVSRIAVTGDVSAAVLKPGMIVRFTGRVNSKGDGTDRIGSLDVITPGETHKWHEVQPDRVMTITASVLSVRRGMVSLKLPTGKLQRLRIILEDSAVAHLDTKDLALSSRGDKVSAKGHVYTNTTGKTSAHLVFASDVTVVKPTAAEGEQKVAAKTP
jgi:hypothetical protein